MRHNPRFLIFLAAAKLFSIVQIFYTKVFTFKDHRDIIYLRHKNLIIHAGVYYDIFSASFFHIPVWIVLCRSKSGVQNLEVRPLCGRILKFLGGVL